MLPVRGKSRCLSREVVSRPIFDLRHRKANEGAPSMMGCDNGRTNAGLDIIASYARNCGKQRRLDAAGTVHSKGGPVSCAIRENIREAGGVCENAVADPNGAKEIDCYV